MVDWYESPFTGLFTRFVPIAPRPHDPDVAIWAGAVPPWRRGDGELPTGGAGWDWRAAQGACIGEAIERARPFPLPRDGSVTASYSAWPLDEPAIEPNRWVLFHRDQYAQPGFPFAPFTRDTVCRWTCCREFITGRPMWVPEDVVYLVPRGDEHHRLCPGVSTGLSCGRVGDPVLLRGLQEVIERDAIVGVWWGRYELEEWPAAHVWSVVGSHLTARLQRANLWYRFYRVRSPFSEHVTLVTLEGDDREGYCFSIGTACRESRAASWRKSLLEVVQGRHYVRQLKGMALTHLEPAADPTTFAEHAVYYSLHPDRLTATPLHRAVPASGDDAAPEEIAATLAARLGPDRPVLSRNLTPPAIASEIGDWSVLRILVPGLQPLHGDHRLAHLGGSLWHPRGLPEWRAALPHPFP